jgi:hypothetical protein
MTDDTSNTPVRVTGQERPHPALRKIGRALIALARHQLGLTSTAEEVTAAPPGDSNQEPGTPETEVRRGE